MLKIKFQVIGKNWSIRLLEKKAFKRKHGKNVLGVTRIDKRQIDLHPDGFDLATINHELAHAFFSEICLNSVNDMSLADFEEVACELISQRGKELLTLGDELFKQVADLTTPSTDKVYPSED